MSKASHCVVVYRDGKAIYQSPVVSYKRASEIASGELKNLQLEMALLFPTYDYFADLWLWLNPKDDQQFTELAVLNLRYQKV